MRQRGVESELDNMFIGKKNCFKKIVQKKKILWRGEKDCANRIRDREEVVFGFFFWVYTVVFSKVQTSQRRK